MATKHILAYPDHDDWYKATKGYTYQLYHAQDDSWDLEVMHQIEVRKFVSYACFVNMMGDYHGMGLFNKDGALLAILMDWYEVQAHIAELVPFANCGWGCSWEMRMD